MDSRTDALRSFDLSIARLEAVRDMAQLEQTFCEIANIYPFAGAVYSWWSHPPPGRAPDYVLASRLDEAEAFDDAVDLWGASLPVISAGAPNGSDVHARVAVLGPRRRFGVFRTVLTVSSNEVERGGNDWRGRLLVLTHLIQDHVSLWREDERPNLGRREIQCLKLAAEGLKAKQIAGALGIGQQTVQFHLSRAREKLGCSNTVQAVARAAQFGLLPDIGPGQAPVAAAPEVRAAD